MDRLEKLLCATREAYALGRTKKQSVEVSDATLQTGLEQEWKTLLTVDEQQLLAQCTHYRNAALQAARQGKYPIAAYLFSTEDEFIQRHALSPIASLIARSMHEAAVAYLDYRQERFETGTARLYQALAYDETLEITYGCSFFHIHRVRLILNLVRLQRRLGASDEALNNSFALLDYLEQKSSSLPFPTNWDNRCLQHLPFLLQNVLFEQAIFEIVFLVVGQERTPTAFLSNLHRHIDAATCRFSPHAHSWLQARLALQEKRPASFLELVSPLLIAGPAETYWLWHGVLIDLLLLCKNLSLAEAHLLLQDIAGDMSAWRWASLPPIWESIYRQASTYIYV